MKMSVHWKTIILYRKLAEAIFQKKQQHKQRLHDQTYHEMCDISLEGNPHNLNGLLPRNLTQ